MSRPTPQLALGGGFWLASIILNAFADHARLALRVRRLVALPFASNLASHRALEKAGFQRGETLREHFQKNGQRLDAVVFSRALR